MFKRNLEEVMDQYFSAALAGMLALPGENNATDAVTIAYSAAKYAIEQRESLYNSLKNGE